jgi:rod shape-determining protein MreC
VPIGVGRRIVSFGSQQSKPYVPGVPIGVVERVDNTPGEVTRTAYARPFTDFSALDVVGVVVAAPKRDPRDAVLPPKPPPPKPPREEQRRGDDGRGQGRASLEAEWGLGDRGRGAGDESRATTERQTREGRPEAARERRGRHGTQAVDGEQYAQEQNAQEPHAQEQYAQEPPTAHERPAAGQPRNAPRQHDGAAADDGRGGRN